MAAFAAGLIVGILAGFFLYPLFWSWIAWREYRQSSRRARRIDDVLEDMSRAFDDGTGRRNGQVRGADSRPGIFRPIGR